MEPMTKRWAGIGILAAASLGFSLVFACAMPFVALVTIAALHMSRRDALIVTGAVWLANQAVGYGFLGYPRDVDTFAWGAAIGIAALLALAAARTVGAFIGQGRPLVVLVSAFAAAFTAYELALIGAAQWLPSSAAAFSWSTIAYLLQVNALGLAVLHLIELSAANVGIISLPRFSTQGGRNR
jgi:hypothetical protein